MSLSLNGRHLKPKIPLCPPPPLHYSFPGFNTQLKMKIRGFYIASYKKVHMFCLNLRNEHDLLYLKHGGFTLALIFMV